MTEFKATAVSTVLAGRFIPAHDETFDIAESIGGQLEAFREYVARVRDESQADNAVAELLTALAPKPDHTFRVTHERTGKVAYEGASYLDASAAQYRENTDGLDKLWRLWLIDPDGIGVIVKTQVE